MPFSWTVDAERQMLFLVIGNMASNPSRETFQKVADTLGGGLNCSAVSQKFYKLKKESEKITNEANNGSAGESSTAAAAASSQPATPGPSTPIKTPTTGRGRGRKRKSDAAETTTPGAEGGDTPASTPAKKARGRKKGTAVANGSAKKSAVTVKEEDNDLREGENGALGGAVGATTGVKVKTEKTEDDGTENGDGDVSGEGHGEMVPDSI
ncbi:hypothetical protein UCRPC4_g00616 [Phaeomoniella chlamydospora]|uniref:Uncharacterized protein n=1 Tax=Phaeomoniella chlamydospora TaxID=158046 RepID=A0A0G2GZ93_PHACM|nr:hypothetical protein UCRPC4_g00616 [Phaeomoniella chlamydospora]